MAIYIYGLHCPIADTIRYVGKSVRPPTRLSDHISEAKRYVTDHHTARWIRKVLSIGNRPSLVILHDVAESERWQDVERQLIAEAAERGWSLTNSTAGGEGLDYLNSEDRDRYLANLSTAMRIVRSTPEMRELSKRVALASWANPEITARRLAAMAAANERPEVRALRSQRLIEINARPEIKAAKSAKLLDEWADPILGEARRSAIQASAPQMALSAQARWADPVKREAGLAAVKSEAKRKKNRIALLARVTPEYREAQAERTRKSWETRNRKVGPAAPETKEKISAALSGRPHSPERRAAIGAAQLGKKRGPQSPEHIAKRLESKRRTEALKLKQAAD